MSPQSERRVSRRGFLTAVGTGAGVAGATSAASAAEAQTTTGNATTTAGTTTGNGTTGGNGTTSGGGGGGETVTVELGDYYFKPGTDSPLYIKPGTTVKFEWKTGGHNIHVDSQPDGANWSGHEPTEGAGFTYSHTFQTKGKYHFWCVPHKGLGMVGDIVVNDSGQAPGGGGQASLDPEELGVPFQAHYVGIATILGVVTTLVFTFYTLKYGESRHASSPNRK